MTDIYEKYEIKDFGDSLLVENYSLKNKIMSKLKTVFHWLVISSANSDKWALTVKAGIPLLVLWGISDTETLNQLTGSIGNLAVLIGQFVTGIATTWGLLRKLYYLYQ